MVEEIYHDAEGGRFYISLDEGPATLEYKHLDEGTVDFYRTFVPRSRRGEGIGGRLVEHAREWARQENYLVRPSCPFVNDHIDRH